jgi:phage host-nuclease inhibitor protein Gam
MTPPTATDSPPETFPWEDSEADVDLENWTPLDLMVPERLLWQLQVVQRRIATLREQVRAMREPIDRWEDRQLHPLAERAAYLEQALEEMGRRYRAADEKHNKTLVLPHGEVRTTSVKPKLEVVDEAAVVSFLRDYAAENEQPVENFLRVKAEVKKDQLNALAQVVEGPAGLVAAAHGQPIPGVQVRPGGVNVKVVVDR